jgi:hypothetical protein
MLFLILKISVVSVISVAKMVFKILVF